MNCHFDKYEKAPCRFQCTEMFSRRITNLQLPAIELLVKESLESSDLCSITSCGVLLFRKASYFFCCFFFFWRKGSLLTGGSFIFITHMLSP